MNKLLKKQAQKKLSICYENDVIFFEKGCFVGKATV